MSETEVTGVVYRKADQKVDHRGPFDNTPLPKVELSGTNLVVNGAQFNLKGKGRTLEVVKAFFANDRPSMSLNRLISHLEGDDQNNRKISEKAKQCRKIALVRLLGRARIEFGRVFQAVTPSGLLWFHFDRQKDQWVLYRLPAAGADGLCY